MNTATETTEKTWRQLLAPYKKPNLRSALVQVLDTALPFVALWGLMAWSLQSSYWLTLALALPTAGLFVRLFIIQHDCGHGSFLPRRVANDALGAVLGVITLFPYGYWKRTHAIHHASVGNLDERELGDIKTLTVREYLALSPIGRFLYRLYRNPIVLFVVGPAFQFLIKHRFPFDIPFSWKREWLSVLWTNAGIVTLYGGLSLLLGWKTVLLVHLPIVLVAGAAGVWLFYVQHQFEETYWAKDDAWDFFRAGAHGSSYYDLPAWLHWFSGNIGYHHVHHLASTIPNYRLAACLRENPTLQRATRLTLRSSLRCARLKLWDEERRALVGFGALREIAPASATQAA